MATITIINHQENLPIYLEGSTLEHLDIEKEFPEEVKAIAATPVIINGEGTLEGAKYITVDLEYTANLSPGQQKAYDLLKAFQLGSVYVSTTVKKLAQAMGLDHPSAAHYRLSHLQTLKAISGYNFSDF